MVGASAYGVVGVFRDELLGLAKEAGATESNVLRIVLEEQMKAGDRKLLRRLVEAKETRQPLFNSRLSQTLTDFLKLMAEFIVRSQELNTDDLFDL